MSVAELFIKRPVMTTLVMIAILLFGVMGYRMLPVSDLPNVDFPTILVSASLPGATPETMASAVAMPLEKQFSTIAGVDSMTSTSTQGFTQITLQFSLSRSLDAAAQDVQSMIAKAGRDLPQSMPYPPSYQKVNPADQPILYVSLSSPTLRLSDVDEYAETLIAQRVSMINGVAQVSVYGVEVDKTASWYYDKEGGIRRAIVLAIQRQPGTNTVEVVDSIKKLLPTFRQQMPPSVNMAILYDRSVSIRDSVNDVKFTLFLALVLVILVIFLFLRNLSATAIPS